MRSISKWLLSGFLLLGLPSSRDPKSPPRHNSAIDIDERANYETELYNLINVKREEALITNTLLMQVAEAHAQDMADNNYLAHGNLTDDHAGARLTRAGYSYLYWGEIIAGGTASPVITLEGWLNSPNHKTVLLDPLFTEVGIGYAYKIDTKYHNYWTVILTVPR